MTTKQNAIDLAKTARSEAANTAKRTITAIVTNWNECVEQAGFTGVFDFPIVGYTRKSQIIADLERCAAQLDDYVEPVKYPEGYTVEQQIREFNATLTRVLDVEEAHIQALAIENLTPEYQAQMAFIAGNDYTTRRALIEEAHTEALEMNKLIDYTRKNHAFRAYWLKSGSGNSFQDTHDWDAMRDEALEMNDAYNTLYVYAPGNAARDVWEQLSPVERVVSVECAHSAALRMNVEFDRARTADDLRAKWYCSNAVIACEYEAYSLEQKKQKLEAIWTGTHRDYKGNTNGLRSILVCRGATVSVPLESLTDSEIELRAYLWSKG